MNNINGEGDTKLYNGRYKISKELGRGGFGVTYLASDISSDNSNCVLKKLNPQSADIKAAKKLFYREARILESLQNTQQIPKFIDYFEEESGLYIVEEYIEGIPLDKIRVGRWSKENVILFLHQILSILSVIHEQNIVHRDIKPANIIKKKETGQFVLIDFGAVKQLKQDEFANQHKQIDPTLIASKGYSPPEQLEGKVGFYSDIYALGVTAIQLLTNLHPADLRRGEDGNVIFPDSLLPDSNDWFANILQKMVYRNLDRRYNSVNEILRELSKIKPIPRLNNGTKLLGDTTQPIQLNNINNHRLKYLKVILVIIFLITSFTALIEWNKPFIRPWFHLYKANNFLDDWRAEAALEEFDKVIKLTPKSVDAWKGRADSLFVLGRNSGALASYDKAISLRPQDVQTRIKILINKGRILYYQRRYKQSLENYEKALEINSKEVEALSGKGISLLGLGKFSEAETSFRELKAIKPNDPKIWYEIGLATENLQGMEKAKKYFQEALQTYKPFLRENPKDVISWTDQGAVLLKLNDPQKALDSFEQALKLDNDFHEALVGKGNALVNLERYQEAVLAFELAIKSRPRDYQVWYNLGYLMLHNIRNYKEALKSFNKSIAYRSDFYPSWVGKGLALLNIEGNEQNLNEALAAFDKAKEINSNDPYIWIQRAEVLRKLGKVKEAQESEQKAKKLET